MLRCDLVFRLKQNGISDISDLVENLSSNPKHFADDTSLFSLVHDLNTSDTWADQWWMSFNLDPLKQAQEVIFSGKINKPCHPDIIFNGDPVKKLKTFRKVS